MRKAIGTRFGEQRAAYDLRPGYPDALWGFLDQAWPARDDLLELGAGNGLATRRLAGSFARVVAVEPDPSMAAWQAPPHVERLQARAEDLRFEPASFDAVAVATALHWMDTDTLLPRLSTWLRPHGLFAAWTYDMPVVEGAVGAYFRDELERHWDTHRLPRLRDPAWTPTALAEHFDVTTEQFTTVAMVPAVAAAGMVRSMSFVNAYARTQASPDAYLDGISAAFAHLARGLVTVTFPVIVAIGRQRPSTA